MTNFYASNIIIHHMHKLLVLNKKRDTRYMHFFTNDYTSCFKYYTPHDNSYMGVMKNIK